MSVGPAITLAGVSVVYGARPALIDASLEIPGGSLFAIMGLSGAGKSTLLRTINRLIAPTSGQVRVGDTDVTGLDAVALRRFRQNVTAMVFQHFGLLPHRNTIDNVAFPLRLQGHAADAARVAGKSWLDRLGLSAVAEASPATLSAGMRQRVGLARALVTDAPVLLMDEPFSALDPITRRAMQDETKGLQRDLGKTVVLITHDPREAFRIADRIAVIHAGRIVQCATPSELRTRPASDHVATLLASADL